MTRRHNWWVQTITRQILAGHFPRFVRWLDEKVFAA